MINVFKKYLILILIFLCAIIFYIGDISAVQIQNLPSNREHIRIFRNFGTLNEIYTNGYDLSFNTEVKISDPSHIALKYELNTTMMAPSEKASQLRDWWCQGLLDCNIPDNWLCEDVNSCDIPEGMFLHFIEDTTITLPPENWSDESWTCTVRGWDPINDMDGNGVISDSEWVSRYNPNASARNMQEARAPAYYWGQYWNLYCGTEQVSHHSDFAMNVADLDYQRFMAEVYIPGVLNNDIYADGIYFDTAVGYWELWKWAGEIGYVEYGNSGEYLLRIRELLKVIRENMTDDKIIIGNGWNSLNSLPRIIDGSHREGWLNISKTFGQFQNAIDLVRNSLKDGAIELIQYTPTYDENYAPNGVNAPVTRERDQIYALASYYLAAGNRSYFGYGQHPYTDDGYLLFNAINVDVGHPIGKYYIFSYENGQGNNILYNSNFEISDYNNDPEGWYLPSPDVVEIAPEDECGLEGKCVRIDIDTISNYLNIQQVTLNPNTTYTLSGFVKTENVSGEDYDYGANFYPYDFDDSTPMLTTCGLKFKGSNEWTFTSCSFTTGTDIDGNIKFRIQHGTGTAWFDKIELREGLPRKVLARRYSKALVLVRPRANDQADYEDPVVYNIQQKGNHKKKKHKIYRQLFADGSFDNPSKSVILNSGEAAILFQD